MNDHLIDTLAKFQSEGRLFWCPYCGEDDYFDRGDIWCCQYCHHHWPTSVAQCKNCHKNQRNRRFVEPVPRGGFTL